MSGQWLRSDDPELVERHYAKVYGRPSVGAPPMSVPHLDMRIVEGRKSLLFGPYAGFSTKFLKHGSLLDLPLSLKPDNLVPHARRRPRQRGPHEIPHRPGASMVAR